jgi:hypothetical protein
VFGIFIYLLFNEKFLTKDIGRFEMRRWCRSDSESLNMQLPLLMISVAAILYFNTVSIDYSTLILKKIMSYLKAN